MRLALLCCLLVGCPAADPDPNADGTLACGDDEVIDALPSGTALPIDAPRTASLRVLLDLGPDGHSARVRVSSPFSAVRMLELTDAVTGDRFIPAQRVDGGDATLEIVALDGGLVSGTASLRCDEPGEDCRNLLDDDGDGGIDCADVACAWDPSCLDGAAPRVVETLDCDGARTLVGPTQGPFDDQIALYGDGGVTAWTFWGGPEIQLLPEAGRLTVTADAAGLLCLGERVEWGVPCDAVAMLQAGDPLEVEVSGAVWLEPEGSFGAVEVSLTCP